jgi:hypothetical protein
MKKALFCTKCFNDKDFKEINGQITHKIKEKEIKESVKKHICQNCGEEIINDRDFDESFLNAFEKYLTMKKEENLNIIFKDNNNNKLEQNFNYSEVECIDILASKKSLSFNLNSGELSIYENDDIFFYGWVESFKINGRSLNYFLNHSLEREQFVNGWFNFNDKLLIEFTPFNKDKTINFKIN